MSFAELKSEVDRLTPEEVQKLRAYLILKDRMNDPKFMQEMSRKLNDPDPSRWLTLEEVEKRLKS
jgi:hypothetical protein